MGTNGKARRILKIGGIVLLALVVLAVAAVLVGKYYYAPRFIHQKLIQTAGGVWDGPVEVGAAGIDFGGTIRVAGVKLKDAQGRNWIDAGGMTISTQGGNPQRVELDKATISLVFQDGHCVWPVRKAERPPEARPAQSPLPFDISANHVTVKLLDAGTGKTAEYDGISLTATRQEHGAGFDIVMASAGGDSATIHAVYDAAGRTFTGTAAVTRRMSEEEMGAILAILRVQDAPVVAMAVRMDGQATVPLDQPSKFEHNIRLDLSDLSMRDSSGQVLTGGAAAVRAENGKMSLALSGASRAGKFAIPNADLQYDVSARRIGGKADGTLDLAGQPEARKFWADKLGGTGLDGSLAFMANGSYASDASPPVQGTLKLTQQTLAVALPLQGRPAIANLTWKELVVTHQAVQATGVNGTVCGGTFDMSAKLDNYRQADRAIQFSLTADRIDLAQLAEAIGKKSDSRYAGAMSGQVDVTAPRGSWEGLTGRGRVQIYHGDFWSVPVISQLFGLLHLPQNESTLSDAQAVMEFAGPVVRIRKGLVANPVAGIEVPDGTINVVTQDVEATIVAGTFLTMNKASRLLGIDKLKESLLAYHVSGKLGSVKPDSFLPISAQQIPDASAKLLQDLSKSGGQIGGDILKGVGDAFQGLHKLVPRLP
jgi:hypothetical protein